MQGFRELRLGQTRFLARLGNFVGLDGGNTGFPLTVQTPGV